MRDDVLKITGNRQEPFVYGSLGGETMALVPHLKAPRDPDAEARVDYELAAQVGTKEAWDSFSLGIPPASLPILPGDRTQSWQLPRKSCEGG